MRIEKKDFITDSQTTHPREPHYTTFKIILRTVYA